MFTIDEEAASQEDGTVLSQSMLGYSNIQNHNNQNELAEIENFNQFQQQAQNMRDIPDLGNSQFFNNDSMLDLDASLLSRDSRTVVS